MAKKEIKPIVVDETPITVTMFKAQGWTKVNDDDEGTKFYYWILPLPKDNPDDEAPVLISSANDEYSDIGIPKGHYVVEIDGFNGLGFCDSEEAIEILYRALTGKEVYDI